MDLTQKIINESLAVIVMSIPVICCVFAVHYRQRGQTLPVTAKRPKRLIRVGELFVLGLLATVVWYHLLLESQYNGEILLFSEVPLAIIHEAHLSMFIAALLLGIVGLLIGAFWRVSAAIPIVILTGATFTTITANSGAWVPALAGFDPNTPPIPIEFKLDDGVENADLWVNGVLLGKTPFTITFDELTRQVPQWEREPDLGSRSAAPNTDSESASPDQRYRRMRVEFYLWPSSSERGWKHFFVAVDRDGEPGTPKPGVTQMGGNSYQGILTAATVKLSVIFPSQVETIEEQLDLARLLDYEPGDAWCEKMAPLSDPAWRKLREASLYEPELDSVMDAWARHKYQLDRAVDGTTAISILKEILADRIEAGSYYTQSLAGRAVRILAPKLDPDQLVDLAIKTFKASDRVSMGILHSGLDAMMSAESRRNKNVYNSWASGSGRSTAHVFVTDAVMLLDFHLDSTEPYSDNAIEERLVPYLLRKNLNPDYRLDDAIFLGGSHVDKFLLNQNWQKQPVDHSDPLRARHLSYETHANRWLIELANYDSPGTDEFRRKQQAELLKLATQILQARDGSSANRWNDGVDFIFLHGHLPGSLAEQFWPVFNGLIENAQDSKEHLPLRYEYLARIYPVSTPEQFCELYEYMPQQKLSYALQRLDQIPATERKPLLEALLKRNQELWDEVDSHPNGRRKQMLKSDRSELERMVEDLDPVAKSQRIAKAVEQNTNEQRTSYREYLTTMQPDARVVALLSRSKIPAIREMAVAAARHHPTAELRAILKTLIDDPDQKVRTAAAEASNELRALLTAASDS